MNEVLVQAFNMMWQGMAGIMVVMGILAGVGAAPTKGGNKKN